MTRPYRPGQSATYSTRRLDGIEKLAVAMISAAMDGCRAGNALDCAWLEHCGLRWIDTVSPLDVDAELVHARLINQLPNSELTPEQASRLARLEMTTRPQQLELEVS